MQKRLATFPDDRRAGIYMLKLLEHPGGGRREAWPTRRKRWGNIGLPGRKAINQAVS